MKVKVSPFLVPHVNTITFTGWRQKVDDHDVPLPEELDHWDYQTRLVLSSFLTLNEPEVLNSCQLGPASRLAILVTAYSEATSTEMRLDLVDVPSGWNDTRALTIEVPGEFFARRLTLETQLVVIRPEPLSGVAPARQGSILWASRQKTYLQGMGAQFPTYAEDFKVTQPSIKNAAWRIQVDTTDPDALFLASVRVVLNSSHPGVKKMLKGTSDAATSQLLRTLDVDVTRRIAAAALSVPEVLDSETDFDDLSVIGGLRSSLALLWPDVPITTLQHELEHDPGAFDARLQENRGF